MAQLGIRPMSRPEVDTLVGWAAAEGWNPGLHDAEVFWATDPEAFIAAELDGELIGGGAITSYGGQFGFMGLFIVRPEFRGKGFGNELWHARLERLRARLAPGAAIGMDGVYAMQPYYAEGGFVFAHRDIRFRLDGERPAAEVATDDAVVSLGEVPFAQVLAYDRTCFPAPRPRFVEPWIHQTSATALGLRSGGTLRGYGVIRRCGEGHKLGPLFADDADAAETLFTHLAAAAPDGPIFLDVPESNPDAVALAGRHGMEEVFGCARMYHGPAPDIAGERVYGVTTFELG